VQLSLHYSCKLVETLLQNVEKNSKHNAKKDNLSPETALFSLKNCKNYPALGDSHPRPPFPLVALPSRLITA